MTIQKTRTQEQWLEYKQLEEIPLTSAESKYLNRRSNLRRGARRWLESLWKSIARLLESTSEPQVWKTYDQQGNPIWHTHDPLTGEEGEWICEDDVRIWLEQRYYQPGQELPLHLMAIEQR